MTGRRMGGWGGQGRTPGDGRPYRVLSGLRAGEERLGFGESTDPELLWNQTSDRPERLERTSESVVWGGGF